MQVTRSFRTPRETGFRHPSFLERQSHRPSPPGAIVVNTARGGLVVDTDLSPRPRGRVAAAAGLDVSGRRAKPGIRIYFAENSISFAAHWQRHNRTRTAMGGRCALDNVDAILSARPAPTLVQPQPAARRVSPGGPSWGDGMERGSVSPKEQTLSAKGMKTRASSYVLDSSGLRPRRARS